MGKNQKPLVIVTHNSTLFNHPNFQALGERGHHLRLLGFDNDGDTFITPDVRIGPECWRIDPALGNLDAQLAMMEKGVRNVKYPKVKKDK